MTGEQVGGIVRTILAAAGGYLAANGYFDAATWQAVAGGITAVIVAIWSYKSKAA